jgi:hypothetical protein
MAWSKRAGNNVKGRAGMTSANLLIVLLVGTAVGALVGLGLGGVFANPWYLAIAAGFIATIVGGIARNVIMMRSGGGPDESRTPTLVIVYSAIASLAGSSAATEVAQQSQVSSPAWIGTLAGLFSAILMAMLMITYHTNPGEAPKLRLRS